jgi:hypothetical protein
MSNHCNVCGCEYLWVHGCGDTCSCVLCEQCLESVITLTLEAYGNGQMMKIECPTCGISYDTNLDPIEVEEGVNK